MDFWKQFLPGAFILCLGAILCGCDPGQNSLDDKKEPHYILGENRVNAMDYQGAVDAFEQSLEVNPHSAAAHFELACLFDEKISDPAAAIYHYQQYLKIDPKAENAEVVNARIATCKQQLAADVMAMPSAPAAQRELERLTDQNRQLQDQIDALKKWNGYYAAQLAAKSNLVSAPNNPGVQQIQNPVQQMQIIPPQNPIANHPANPAAPRTHAVASGETEAAIARKFGIKLSALQAANPGVNPSKLHVGQILNI
ncbi:MAG TPA: LysM peptidoglycan-binding domain-containing protein, partial [Dongiaceae bacterium]|nr:LysM peptidoglycan-binding domain-containing protein [Dongiaceae bacterium]